MGNSITVFGLDPGSLAAIIVFVVALFSAVLGYMRDALSGGSHDSERELIEAIRRLEAAQERTTSAIESAEEEIVSAICQG